MLSKASVLAIGSIVKVYFKEDENETVVVIVGHLTLSGDTRCHYDYICIEFPGGIEKGLLYINHPDITDVLYSCPDHGGMHSKWMERKYGDYLGYYNHYCADSRPDISDMRHSIAMSENIVKRYKRKKQLIMWTVFIISIIGIGITAFITKQWLAVPGALFLGVLGYINGKQ